MSRTYATPLEVEIKKSHSLILLVLFIAVIAIICIILLPIAVIIKLPVCVFIVAAAYFSIIKNNLHRQLIWHDDNDWVIKSNSADIKAALLPDSYVSPWLAILCFRTDENKKLSVLIFNDAIHPEQFRRLRGRLTIEGTKLFSGRADSP